MNFISIISTSEGDYVGVKLSNDDSNIEYTSGDLIKDWFDCIQNLIMNAHEKNNGVLDSIMTSSEFNHLSDYNINLISGYLHIIDGEGILKYFDYEDPNWWMNDLTTDKGIEMFVPDETWTWQQLKDYCKNHGTKSGEFNHVSVTK